MIYEINKRHTSCNKTLLISDTIKDTQYIYYFRYMYCAMTYHKSIILYKNLCYSIFHYSDDYLDGYNIFIDKIAKRNLKNYEFRSIVKHYNFKFGQSAIN